MDPDDNETSGTQFSPDGKFAFVFSKDTKLVDVVTRKTILNFGFVRARFSPTGKYFVIWDYNETSETQSVQFWNLATRSKIRLLEGSGFLSYSAKGDFMITRRGSQYFV